MMGSNSCPRSYTSRNSGVAASAHQFQSNIPADSGGRPTVFNGSHPQLQRKDPRELGISRRFLHLHLQKLQDAGLVASRLALSQEGKALNYFEVCSFPFELEPGAIAEAARSLTAKLET